MRNARFWQQHLPGERCGPEADLLLHESGNRALVHEMRGGGGEAADFQRMYAVNMLAVATLTQAAAQKMAPGSRIVNIASRAYLGAKNHPHYVASKAALVGYTRACAMELAAKDILVNAIAPGLIDTPLLQALTPERRAAQLALQPSGRAGTPQEIAEAVAFLASPRMGFITGQVLFVDGGKSLGGT